MDGWVVELGGGGEGAGERTHAPCSLMLAPSMGGWEADTLERKLQQGACVVFCTGVPEFCGVIMTIFMGRFCPTQFVCLTLPFHQ